MYVDSTDFASKLVTIVGLGIGVLVLLSLVRAVKGPTVFDRAAGVGLIGTKSTVLLVILGFAYHERVEMFVDISLGYALLGFIGVLALSRFLEEQAA